MIDVFRRPLGAVPLGKLAFELFLVFVAVTAAMFANGWWQGRQAAAAGRSATAAFASEMQRNRDQISARLEHHRKVPANAAALMQDLLAGKEAARDVRSLRERLFDRQGMRMPLLSHAAWDTAVAAGAAAEIPLATLQRIAVVYEVQRRLDGLFAGLIANFTSPIYFDLERAQATLTAMVVTFDMIVELEIELMNSYDDCMPHLAVS